MTTTTALPAATLAAPDCCAPLDAPSLSDDQAEATARLFKALDAMVIELAPPAVQTDLTPGQATREGYMPLDAFADEVIALFQSDPGAPEILVERVKPLRFAEREGQTDVWLERLAAV